MGISVSPSLDTSIFRAYDIRGVYPSQLNEQDAYRIAHGIFEYLDSPKVVAVGRDVRLSAPAIQAAVCQAMTELGAQVLELGLVSSDVRTLVTGQKLADVAIIISASHNPKEWIGMKISRSGGAEVGGDGEIQAIGRLVAEKYLDKQYVPRDVGCEQLEMVPIWLDHIFSLIDKDAIAPLTVVADAGNGIAGPIVREFFERLNAERPIEVRCKLVELYFEPDGNFPNHLPSPIEPENMKDLQSLVVSERADVGIAFDGDADRIFLVDEHGQIVSGSEMTAMLLDAILTEDSSRVVLYNAICGWNVLDVVKKHNATAHRTRVGHGFIKKDMLRHSAYFAGEHSGHYFFQNTFNADSGLIAAAMVLELMGKTGKALTELLAEHRKYVSITETNFRVSDVGMALNAIKAKFSGLRIDELDGLSIYADDYWVNIRPSQTEPLLRLNVEAKNKTTLTRVATDLAETITTLGQPSGRRF